MTGTDIYVSSINSSCLSYLSVVGTADCPEVCQLQPAQRLAEWRFVSLSVLRLLQEITDEGKWCQGIRERFLWISAISRDCILHVWPHPCRRLNRLCILNSMEGHGDVLQDLGRGEASHPKGVVLQASIWLAQLLQLPASCQPKHSRSSKFN
jgi:hypothetical protein